MPGTVVESVVAGTELERVLPKVTTVFESDDTFLGNIKKRDVEVVSYREMRAPMELRPGGRFQYFNPDGGDLGRGGGPTWDKAVVRPVFLSENIEYTKLTQWSTDDRRKSVINAVRRLTAGATVEIKRQLDAQLQGSRRRLENGSYFQQRSVSVVGFPVYPCSAGTISQ